MRQISFCNVTKGPEGELESSRTPLEQAVYRFNATARALGTVSLEPHRVCSASFVFRIVLRCGPLLDVLARRQLRSCYLSFAGREVNDREPVGEAS